MTASLLTECCSI